MKPAPDRMRTTITSAAVGLGVTLAYVATAQLGFRVAFVAEQVTTVWAPTGISEAALLLWGTRLWPAAWIGAFLANITSDAPTWTAVGVATGNTLEAVGAAWMLRRLSFDLAFGRTRDSVNFILIGAMAAPVISATIGVTTLCAGQVQPWIRFWPLWIDWFVGDALGALVVAPVLLTALRTPRRSTTRQRLETAILIVCMVIVTNFVFGATLRTGIGAHSLEFVVFPLVIAAAVRLRQPATSLVVLSASAVSIWHTVQGSGPFAAESVHESLILLQVFTGVLASSGLVLAAATTEHRTADRRRAAAHAVGQVLANAPNIHEAAPGILSAVCTNLDWTAGALWTIDRDLQELRPVSVWTRDGEATPFTAATNATTFARGVGLPGRVWESGEPAWIEDVSRDANFPRGPVARQSGLQSAFGFPIRMGGEVLGVVECFQRTAAAPDADLLATMAIVGDQIGQFIARTRTELVVHQSESRTRAILDVALDAIIAMDHRGTITDINPAAERMFGYARPDVIGQELAALMIPRGLQERHRLGLQRYQIHAEGRSRPDRTRRLDRSRAHSRGRRRPRDRAGLPAARIRSLQPGRRLVDAGIWRPGAGPGHREAPVRAARWVGASGKSGSGQRRHLHDRITTIIWAPPFLISLAPFKAKTPLWRRTDAADVESCRQRHPDPDWAHDRAGAGWRPVHPRWPRSRGRVRYQSRRPDRRFDLDTCAGCRTRSSLAGPRGGSHRAAPAAGHRLVARLRD